MCIRDRRTTFDGIDIVYVRVDIFVIRRIVHDSHFHRCALFLCVDVDYIIDVYKRQAS